MSNVESYCDHVRYVRLMWSLTVEALIFRDHGNAYLKRNSRFSAKTLLITFKKHTLLSKQTFQRYFENRNSQYLTTLIFVSVTLN